GRARSTCGVLCADVRDHLGRRPPGGRGPSWHRGAARVLRGGLRANALGAALDGPARRRRRSEEAARWSGQMARRGAVVPRGPRRAAAVVGGRIAAGRRFWGGNRGLRLDGGPPAAARAALHRPGAHRGGDRVARLRPAGTAGTRGRAHRQRRARRGLGRVAPAGLRPAGLPAERRPLPALHGGAGRAVGPDDLDIQGHRRELLAGILFHLAVNATI
ncbi:MAG: hypothetical protein AVDCRST_MAG05-712, partial [uncultured Rubrobacteraceae bacterium]